ncbi:MAG: hypothetical protein AAF709_25595 [Pseudomonadota bacterium]
MMNRPEFDHQPARIAGGFLDMWGDGPIVIRHAGKEWRFEFSVMFGPSLLTKQGEVAVRQPISDRHPFWDPFNRWMKAGKRCRAVRTKRGKLRFWLGYVPQEITPDRH